MVKPEKLTFKRFFICNNAGREKFTALAIFLFAALTACVRAPQWRTADGAAWGTTYHISYSGDRDLSDSVIAVMRDVERAVSMFDPTSNVSLVNAGITDSVGPVFAEVFNRSRHISQLSAGYFDPTVAPLVDLWGFGRKKDVKETPDSARVTQALASVGIANCYITDDGRIVRKSPSTEFDFSAIAKGYGVDAVADMLRRNGCTDFMVEIGGEVRVSGHNPRGDEWRLQIDDPVASGRDGHVRLAVVNLTDAALATSGNYRNFKEMPDGRLVTHTLSAITGYPAESDVLSVSVIAPDCMTADGLATACMAMPTDRAKAMIGRLSGVSALFVISLPDGGYKVETAGETKYWGQIAMPEDKR